MCDCFHIAFPNWHAAESSGHGGRRLRAPEPGTHDDSTCEDSSQFTEGERPRPQGSSPVDEFPEDHKYDSDKEFEADHDSFSKGKKSKRSGLGAIFDKRSTPKMSKLKEKSSPEAAVLVQLARDGGAEGLVYGGGGRDGIFIKEVVPESPAYRNLHLREGDQVLSATVYFDDIPYEDAVQILEQAQSYKVKLCLKRKPETETEGAANAEAIPEDELHQPEMRESGKKRRGDARISWPKFPSLGRGKKSRFTRSHSSSEADEQRKLELSPTTSDTESPIKTQDALKGKKKHKIKLPGMKRGRISSSEDRDAQNLQTDDRISPVQSPKRETQDASDEQNKGHEEKVNISETGVYKTELVCVDSTVKTADITVALEQESPSKAAVSPDGKKKKKERSELKLTFLGKDKKQKAKSSPKRLKTLGASLEKGDDKENEKAEAVSKPENVMDSEVPKMTLSKSSQMELRLPKVEIDISDVGIICKSNDKKGKGSEEKQRKPGFKLPKVALSEVTTEEIIKIDTNISKKKDKNDAYDRLDKGTELPKREDIEIPGMEDVSKTRDFKEPKAPLACVPEAELQADTVLMSIDVDSVKEAVSKLPGYKLPKVDMSGTPIPEEFTVIDANAQRISVKTPTKGKQETMSVFTESTKTTYKLPQVKADVRSEISETKVGIKKLELDSKDLISTKAIISQTIEVEKVQKEYFNISSVTVETSKDTKIKTPKTDLPDVSIQKSDIKIPDFKLDLTKKKEDKIQLERTIFLPGDIDVKSVGVEQIKTTEKPDENFKMPSVGISLPKVKSEVSGSSMELEVDEPKLEPTNIAKFGIKLKSPAVSLTKKNDEIMLPEAKMEVDVPKVDVQIKREDAKFKLPKLGLKMPKINAPELDLSLLKDSKAKVPTADDKGVEVSVTELKIEVKSPSTHADIEGEKFKMPPLGVKLPKAKTHEVGFEIAEPKISLSSPEKKIEGEADGRGGKFKLPKLGIAMPKMKGPELGLNVEAALSEDKESQPEKNDQIRVDVDGVDASLSVKATTGEIDAKSGKFKMPKLGLSMPKVKGPEIDQSTVKVPTVHVTVGKVILPEAEMGKASVGIKPFEAKLDVEKPEVEDKGGKFKTPRFTVAVPKVKGPDVDFSLPKTEVKLYEIKTEIQLPEVTKVGASLGKVEVKIPDAKLEADCPKVDVDVKPLQIDVDTEGHGGKFTMPEFGIKMPKVNGPDFDISLPKREIKSPEIKAEIQLPKVPKVDVSLEKGEVKVPEVEFPEMELDIEGHGGKFKMPKFGIKMPTLKGPDVDISFPKKEVKSPEVKAEIQLPEVPQVTASSGKTEVIIPDAKFKMPKFGIKMPKVKGPDYDISLTTKEIKSPEVKAEIQLPEVPKVDVSLEKGEVKVPEATVEVECPEMEVDIEEDSGKFKMPKFEIKISTFKGPDVDISLPNTEVKSPEMKAKIQLPEVPRVEASLGRGAVEVDAPDVAGVMVKPPSGKMKIKAPDIDVSVTEDSPTRFKFPSLGISVPKMKAPEVDFNVTKKDVDMTVPDAKAEGSGRADGKEVNVSTRGSPLKFKMPTFKLPKFGGSFEEKECEIKMEGSDLSVSVPHVDLPAVSAEVILPETETASGEVVIEQPTGLDMDVKFKKPRFSLPRFSFSKQSVPEAEISVSQVDIPQVEGRVEITGDIDVKSPEREVQTDASGGKFKLPKFGFSMPKISAPEIDLSLSKADAEATLPEAKLEVKVPDVEVKGPSIEAEIKSPEIKVETKSKEGSPSKLKMPTFKLPKFGVSIPEAEVKVDEADVGQVDVELPEVKTKINLPEAEVKAPSVEVEVEQPSDLELEAKFKKPRFSMPRFSFSKQNVPALEADISIPQVDVPETEAKVEVKGELDIKSPEVDVQTETSGGKFKLPKFGLSMPKISAPEIDLSLSKTEAEVTLPEAKIQGQLPGVEVKGPSIEADIKAPEIKVETKTKEGSPSKLKMPTFKFPKFGGSISEAEVKVDGPDFSAEGPHVDLPDVKAEVHIPSAEMKVPSGEVVIEQPPGLEMDAKFKKPRFSLPRFSFSKQSVQMPETDVEAEINVPETEMKVEITGDIDVKSPELGVQTDASGGKFKLPKFGFSMPKISAPEIDLSLSKADAEATLPEAKLEVKVPDVEVKGPSIEAEIKSPEIKVETKSKEGSPSKLKMPTFKLPKFGVSIPEAEVKVDEADVGQVDVELPEVKTKINLPEVEVKAPSVEVEVEQPSDLELEAKFKKPRFSMPRFSFSKQSVPALEADISIPQVDVPETEAKVEVKGELDIKSPEVDVQTETSGGKFKLPKFGLSMPKISAPEIDLSLSKTEAEVTLPEAKIQGQLPGLEVKGPSIEADIKAPEIKVETKTKEGSPSKLKMPTFKFPKFGGSISEAEVKVDGPDFSAEGPHVDLPDVKAEVHIPSAEMKVPSGEVVIEQPPGLEMDAKFKKPRFSLPRFSFSKQSVQMPETDVGAEINVPETEMKVEITGDIDMKSPELGVQTDASGGKFKLPKFGFSMPKISAPEIDLSLSKADAEATLPEAKLEVKVPDVEVKGPSIEAEIKSPEIKVETKSKEGSPSKLKMPTFKLPKVGVSIPEAEVKVDGADVGQVDVELPEVKTKINLPEVEVKAPSVEVEVEKPSDLELEAKFKKPRFSMPRFSFSKQSVPALEADISIPQVDVPETEAKVEVKGELDIKSPEVDVQTETSGGKFQLPKFGLSMPKISAPEIDLSLSKAEAEGTLPEAKIQGQLPGVEVKGPSIEAEIKAPEIKVETKTKEGSPSKLKMPTFKFPKFGYAIPEAEGKVDGPDFSAEHPHVDLPDVKAEVHIPSAEMKVPSGEVVIEQPPGLEMDAKFKKPRFSLPRFSFSKQSVQMPETDVGAEINVPETEMKVEITGDIDVKSPELGVQTDASGGKFKLPKFGFSMPKISAPEIDLSLSKADAEATLPGAKLEAKVPDVEVKGPSIEAEIKSPEIKVETKSKEGSPSKLKMPTFKLPKFGVSIPEAEVKVDGADVGQVDVELPEVKTKINLPEVEVKAPSVEVEVEQPSDLELEAKFKKPRFSMPRFSFSKQNVPALEADISIPQVDVPETEAKVEVKGELDIKSPGVDVQTETSGGKFKLPKFGLSMPKISAPEIDLSLSKTAAEVTLPEAKIQGQLPGVEVKGPSIEAEIKAPEIKVETKTKEGSPSKLKMPTFKFPKFGYAIPEAEGKVDGPDMSVVPQVDIDVPDVDVAVHLPETKVVSGEVVIEQPTGLDMDVKFKKPRFSLPRFSFSKQSVPAPETDVSVPEANASVEGKTEAEIEMTAPKVEAQVDGQGSTFKFPKFGISMPKMSPPDVDLSLSEKDAKVSLPEAHVEISSSEVKVESKLTDGSPSKMKMPSFRIPKFGADIKADIPEEILTVKTESSLVEIKMSAPEVKRSKFKMPSLGFSSSGPDVSVEEKDMQLPDVELKDMDIKVSAMEGSNAEGSPSKFKMPTFKLPKFGATVQVDGEVPDVDSGKKVEVSKTDVDGEKSEETKGSWSLPKLSFSKPSVTLTEMEASVPVPKKGVESPNGKTQVEGQATSEIDIKLKKPRFSLPKISFAKQPSLESEAEVGGTVDKQSDMDQKTEVEVEAQGGKFKMPKFGISMPKVKGPEIDVKKEADISDASMKVEASPTKFKMPSLKLPKIGVSTEPSDEDQSPRPELDAAAKTQEKKEQGGSKFSFGISLPKVKGPEIDVSLSTVDSDSKVASTVPEEEQNKASWPFPKFSFSKPTVALESEVDVSSDPHKDAAAEDSPAAEPEMKVKFSLPRFSFSKTPAKETPETAVALEVSLTEGEVKVKEPKEPIPEEVDSKPKETVGSPSRFKMPLFKMPKIGLAATVSEESSITSKETETLKIINEGGSVVITAESPSVEVKTDTKSPEIKKDQSQESSLLRESPQSDAQSSPSKFRLTSFKMPRLSFSKASPDDDTFSKVDKMETHSKDETKSPKKALSSIGEILKNNDGEFDVSSPVEEHGDSPVKKLEQETVKKEAKPQTMSPEKTSWFKFPSFGLSSPTKEEKKSPIDEELSLTCSIQSSEAFADISSTMTSENVGFSMSSPTKVTVKYLDPDTTEANLVTSTTKTEVVSFEPHLAEKVTILSSSSEDTLKLESGKIHIVSSNIQAAPESQQAQVFQSSQTTFTERRLQSSSQQVVITKQITRVVTASEPISDQTATSIQLLKDSVHSDKMKFFDKAEK